LKHRGYRRVVLAGQSFGAFISLIAAGHSGAVDTVIGTAPAAYGSAQSDPTGYPLNATGSTTCLVRCGGRVSRSSSSRVTSSTRVGAPRLRIRCSARTDWHISSSIGLSGSRAIGPAPAPHSPRNSRRVSSRCSRRRGARYSRLPQPGSRASAGQPAARLSFLRAPPNFRPLSGFFPAYSSCNPAMSALPVA